MRLPPSRSVAALVPLLLALPAALAGQTIGGRVLDQATRLPLRRAAAALLANGDTVVRRTETDTLGIFYLTAPGAGRYRVEFAVGPGQTFVSDTLDVAADAFVQREFHVALPRERVYFEFEVEKPVLPLPGVLGPRYPDELKKGNVQGEVLAQFIVDTTGRVRPGSFKVLRATDPAFTESVRRFLSAARYSPAEIRGRKIPQLVQQPFKFELTY